MIGEKSWLKASKAEPIFEVACASALKHLAAEGLETMREPVDSDRNAKPVLFWQLPLQNDFRRSWVAVFNASHIAK